MTQTRWPEARAPRGMVATPHLLATQSGVAALRAGGNALDAAVAAAATIAVVYPHMNGLGGDSVWLIYDARSQRLRTLCAVGRAARAASIEWYAARGVSGALPTRGGPAALTVPAAVDGWWQAHQYSRSSMRSPLAWPALLGDAVLYAREGFAASEGQRTPPPREPDLFGERAPEVIRQSLWPLYHPDALRRGPLVQRDLGRTLEAIRDGGAEAFYRGDLARRLVAAAAAAGSPLAIEDLIEHRSDWMDPLRIPYAEGHVASAPPPTQGISALAVLGLTERFDMASLPEADYIHVLVEATKLAFEDRDRHLTDPAFMRVAPADLLAPDRLQSRGRLISRERVRPPQPVGPAAGDTIALVTADRDGNAVSVIQSLYFTFGSGLMAGDTGVVLQNRGSFFSLDPGHVNALAPGKRTMHTLIPSMYLEGGRPRFVYGTMGGEGQPQTQAAILTRRLFRRLGPQAAIEAPRWLLGRTWGQTSDTLKLESRFAPAVVDDLRRRGHDVELVGAYDEIVGHAGCVIRHPDGSFEGGADPRSDGSVAAY